jgi:hypothetical protein
LEGIAAIGLIALNAYDVVKILFTFKISGEVCARGGVGEACGTVESIVVGGYLLNVSTSPRVAQDIQSGGNEVGRRLVGVVATAGGEGEGVGNATYSVTPPPIRQALRPRKLPWK